MHRQSSLFSSQVDAMNPSFPDHEHLNCPRCDSTNTKFCYYNNYNLSQPRFFCKHCRRYWTKGGTLRNIPIGGGTRKITKRASNSNKRASTATSQPPSRPPPPSLPPKPELSDASGVGSHHMESGGGFSSLLGSNPMGPFENLLMDGLSSSLVGKSDDDVLIRNPTADHLRSNLLRLNDTSNQNGGRGESGSWNGGENGWPGLSIFTPGSSFH